MKPKLFFIPAMIIFSCIIPLSGQESASAFKPDIGLDLGLGVHAFPSTVGSPENFQFISLSPDFSVGKFGIGLLIPLHYRFTGNSSSMIEVRTEDWYRSTFIDTVALYFSKIQYARYGLKGEPLYVKLGSVNDGTLGNGFIFGGYSNMTRLPNDRYFGLSLDIDGALFNFPYIGSEVIAGDLFAFDVGGVRLYGRPLKAFEIPILSELQIGGTAALDRLPFRFSLETGGEPGALILGLDYRLPIVSTPVVSLSQYADFVSERTAIGGMIGIGGTVFGFIPYGFQIRLLGENFIPVYFDSTYDSYRAVKYHIYRGDTSIPSNFGWLFNSGFNLLDGRLAFSATIDGLFQPAPGTAGSQIGLQSLTEPHLNMVFFLKEGIIPNLSFAASYDKKGISSFGELFNPADAVIHADLNYRTGPAVITVFYDIKYNPIKPGSEKWDVTSGIETKISLFRAED